MTTSQSRADIKNRRVGFWLLMLSTVALAFKGVLAKFAFAENVSIDALLMLRFSLNIPLLWIVLLIYYRGNLPKLSLRHIALVAVMALLSNYLAGKADFKAIELIGAGLSRVLLYTYPIFVLLLNMIFEKKLPSLSRIILLILIQIGLFLAISNGDVNVFNANLIGALNGVASAFFLACYLVLLGFKGKHIPSQILIFYMMIFASFFMMFDFALTNDISELSFSYAGWGWVLAMAIFCTSLPLMMLIEAVKRMGSNDTALLGCVNVVMVLGLSYLLLDEVFSPLQLIGASIIIACVYILSKPVAIE